jgi:hypothetical protein
MRDETVHVSFNVDYTNQVFRAAFNDGTSIATTQSFAITGAPGIVTLGVYKDKRYDGLGADFDNFKVSTVPIPEPASWALFGIGFGVLRIATCTLRRRVPFV